MKARHRRPAEDYPAAPVLNDRLHHRQFTAAKLAAGRDQSVSVCLPARDEAATIGPIVDALMPLVERGAIDQVVVVDESSDGTGDIARARGAEVHRQSSLMPAFGPVQGKGDAMWRALSVLRGDVVCYLDADSADLGPHFALGLVGPLVVGARRASFVKGHYRRPLRLGGTTLPSGGGRVTELLARPLLQRFYPELGGVLQPLAGEVAARRDLLERLPFATGYAVDIGLLVDAWRQVGTEGVCAAAEGADLLRGRLRLRLAAAKVQRHVEARAREAERDGAAEALRATGHQRRARDRVGDGHAAPE